MELEYGLNDLLLSVIVFFVLYLAGFGLRKKFQVSLGRYSLLYIFHSIFSLIYIYYSLSHPADAIGYYEVLKREQNFTYNIGVGTVEFVVLLLSKLMIRDYISITLVFGYFGFIGLLALDSALASLNFASNRLTKLLCSMLVFLPSINFWSSGLGKDSLVFMSICLIVWLGTNSKRHLFTLLFATLVMSLLRPHIAALLIVSGIIYLVVYCYRNNPKYLIFPFVLFGLLCLSFNPLMEYVKLTNISGLDDIFAYIRLRASFNQEGGGAIDIMSMTIFEQLFAYLFRPIFFDVNSSFSFFASIDNIYLLIVFLIGIWNKIMGRSGKSIGAPLFFIFYGFVTTLILATTTANLGISLRQKWMVVPVLLLIIYGSVSNRHRNIKFQVPNNDDAK